MARFLHLADLHLGAPLNYIQDMHKREARRQDLTDAFSRAAEFALDPQNSIDGVIIAGDLFDSPNPPRPLIQIVQLLAEKLSGARIPVILTPGTHDSALHPASVFRKNTFPGFTVLMEPNPETPAVIKIKDRPFYFYGFDYNPLKTKMPLKISRVCEDGVHVGVLHCSLMLKSHWSAEETHVPVKPDQIEKWRLDYLALGHYHNFSMHNIGDTTVLYPGTLEGRKFSEDGPRFLTIVEISESRKPAVEKIPWNRRTLINAVIDLNREGIENNGDIIQALSTYSAGATEILLNVRLEGSREFPLNGEMIAGRLSGDFFHIQITDGSSMAGSGAVQAILREKSIRGLFAKKISEKLSRAQGQEREKYSFALTAALEKMRGDEPFEI